MPKKIKLDLDELNVESFLTRKPESLKGGIYTLEYHPCNTNENGCIPDSDFPKFCC